MKRSPILLVFPALAIAVIGVFFLSPEPESPGVNRNSSPALAADVAGSHSTAAGRANDWTPADRSSTPVDQPTGKRPPVGSVFAPPQTSRTGSFAPAAPVASRGGGDGPLRPVGGWVLGDGTGFEIDPGVPIPAVLTPVAPEVGLSEEQTALNLQIATAFARNVDSSPDPSVAWPVERVRADNRFRLLFGDDLYRQQVVKAAREARGTDQP